MYWDLVAERCPGNEQLLVCDLCAKLIRHPCRAAVCSQCNFDLCSNCYETYEPAATTSSGEVKDTEKAAPVKPKKNAFLSFFIKCSPSLTDTDSADDSFNEPENREVEIARDKNFVFVEPTSAERYNLTKPKYGGKRISIDSYPDPVDFGWIFTGSLRDSEVAFYERVLERCFVKLDFYYTTGAVRALLEHPTMGASIVHKRKGCEVTPIFYEEVLRNPLSETTVSDYIKEEDSCPKHDDDDSINSEVWLRLL